MNKLLMAAILFSIGLHAFADTIESKSESRTLFLMNEVKDNCASEFKQVIDVKLKILDILRIEDYVDGKSKIVSIMQAGFYPHPLTGPKPQVVRILKVTQVQLEGPIAADRGPFYDTTCELMDSKGNKIN